jgi:acyl-CoA thioester hydrolase
MAGHVNNAIYFSYFENARIHYLGTLFGEHRNWQEEGIILRTNEIEYFAPIYLEDKPTIEVYVESIGSKSYTLVYEVRVGNELKTIGKSVVVCYNSLAKMTYELSNEDRALLEKLKRY